jgi:hypothetical protein
LRDRPRPSHGGTAWGDKTGGPQPGGSRHGRAAQPVRVPAQPRRPPPQPHHVEDRLLSLKQTAFLSIRPRRIVRVVSPSGQPRALGPPPSRGPAPAPSIPTQQTFRWFFVGGLVHRGGMPVRGHRVATGQRLIFWSGRRDSNPRPPPWQGGGTRFADLRRCPYLTRELCVFVPVQRRRFGSLRVRSRDPDGTPAP